ncbi:hypothetical protein B0H17DRAFT_1214436 [Mycena rosella]|uniref:Uncharacterized protein n=1 Tax=Mycena rosella TaxID=1033263 RepID=A0AAD7G337_MYCRO|nr:hypothetical protein B0H17DRAFT_1214436 [Mycena rosella]
MSNPSVHSSAIEIPYDIASAIFILCLPANGRVHPSPKQHSRFWRESADIGVLWLSRRPNSGPRYYDRPRLLLTSDLRAQYAIRYPSHFAPYPIPESWRAFILAILKARATQWGRIELQINERNLLHLNEMGPFPMLQSLAMQSAGPSIRQTWNTSLYNRAPNLKALRLGARFCARFPAEAFAIAPSLTALEFRDTTLFGTTYDFPPVLQFLARSGSGLTHLALNVPSQFTDTLSECLPAVSNLDLTLQTFDRTIYRLLECANLLSRLETLRVAYRGAEYTTPADHAAAPNDDDIARLTALHALEDLWNYLTKKATQATKDTLDTGGGAPELAKKKPAVRNRP